MTGVGRTDRRGTGTAGAPFDAPDARAGLPAGDEAGDELPAPDDALPAPDGEPAVVDAAAAAESTAVVLAGSAAEAEPVVDPADSVLAVVDSALGCAESVACSDAFAVKVSAVGVAGLFAVSRFIEAIEGADEPISGGSGATGGSGFTGAGAGGIVGHSPVIGAAGTAVIGAAGTAVIGAAGTAVIGAAGTAVIGSAVPTMDEAVVGMIGDPCGDWLSTDILPRSVIEMCHDDRSEVGFAEVERAHLVAVSPALTDVELVLVRPFQWTVASWSSMLERS